MRASHIAAALAAATLGLSIAAANAETMTFKAVLSGPAETPPTDSKGTGTLTATYDTATRTLAWTVDYSGLTGPAIAAHFHGPAPAGKPAPIEVAQKPPLASPMKGSAVLTAEQAKDLTDGMLYFNIHTAEHKPGEIRGQVEKAM
ncbi:CHRD domain-containing protein [Roseiarcus fermentans]|uniref:CHRD domain-containing protein n=1 Tax=Roseiarcus fermentans TaxID=1473586 RepID=A0A366EQ62_9HYPH|nr:CHRD domain-containing protein [Roseiarcus fermentans]RBP04553.1 CHRD domain-containing protein [Roseiarcus fermentans]